MSKLERGKVRLAWALGGVIAVAVFLSWLGARHDAPSEAMPSVAPDASASASGAAAFIGADFSGLSLETLESHALPWKLVMAVLVMDATRNDPALPADLSTASRVLEGFGFLPQARVKNLVDGVGPRPSGLPLGVTYGTLSPLAGAPVQVANLGCAACHAGVTYDARGMPQPDAAWIGMPNTSLNLEAYTQSIFDAFRANGDPDAVMAMVHTLYPDIDWREGAALRWLVLPLVQARLNGIVSDRPLPFPNGVPGSTNGVAALKHVMGTELIGGGPGDAGIVSIPDLGHRHWRTSLLADGAYAVPGATPAQAVTPEDDTAEKRAALAAITTFFTVPSMGVDPDVARDAIPVAEDIFAFLAEAYRPQPFPGPIDAEQAARGSAVYEAQCSACHGAYTDTGEGPRLQRFPNWYGDVGTDRLRAESFTSALAERVNDTTYHDIIEARANNTYAAPPLTGVWASAPYLHNGSVPTMWALLTPEARPERFALGGHALDFERMGLRLNGETYPNGYLPFSTPVLFDTTEPGKGNQGHAFGATLSDADKRALIAFLAQL